MYATVHGQFLWEFGNNALKFLTLSGLRVFLVIVGLMADLGSTCTIGITALVS